MVASSQRDAVLASSTRENDPAAARDALMEQDWPANDVADFIRLIDDPGHAVVDGKYRLSEAQARAILDLRLQRLTGLERDKLVDETRELSTKTGGYLEILQSRSRLFDVMRGEDRKRIV